MKQHVYAVLRLKLHSLKMLSSWFLYCHKSGEFRFVMYKGAPRAFPPPAGTKLHCSSVHAGGGAGVG